MPDRLSLTLPELLTAATDQAAAVSDDLGRLGRLSTLGTMTAGIAHELNNLLTPVLGYAQMAAAHPEDADLQARAMQKVIGGIEAASQVARAILGFAASDGHAQSTADVDVALDAALSCLARPLDRDGIELHREISRGATAAIGATSLQHVLLNLILNARRAMRNCNERLLTITAYRQGRGPAEMVMIEISDTGPGVAAHLRGLLFDLFVSGTAESGSAVGDGQAMSIAHRDGEDAGGHGLGLPICRHLVEQAGGWIDEVSAPGEGARFIIGLPVAAGVQSRSGLAKAG